MQATFQGDIEITKKVAIVGNSADKFCTETWAKAKGIVHAILTEPNIEVVSGHSPLGGIDIMAEVMAEEQSVPTKIFPAKNNQWNGEGGYKERNRQIAEYSDEVHVIVVAEYPENYSGHRFPNCYHCENKRPTHVKSGACWVGKRADEMGKRVHWHIIKTGEANEH